MCVKQFAQRGLCVVEKAGVDSHPRDGTVQRSFALESGDRTRTNSVVGVEPQIRVRGEVLEFVSLDRPVFETCDAIGSEIGQTLTDCAIPEWVAQISSTPEVGVQIPIFQALGNRHFAAVPFTGFDSGITALMH